MKNINKKNIDILSEIKKDKNYLLYSKDSNLRIRLAVEVFKTREGMGISQVNLAKDIHSTQRIISNIENAEINISIGLLNRIMERLKFDSDTLAKIFNRDLGPYTYGIFANDSSYNKNIVQFKSQINNLIK